MRETTLPLSGRTRIIHRTREFRARHENPDRTAIDKHTLRFVNNKWCEFGCVLTSTVFLDKSGLSSKLSKVVAEFASKIARVRLRRSYC